MTPIVEPVAYSDVLKNMAPDTKDLTLWEIRIAENYPHTARGFDGGTEYRQCRETFYATRTRSDSTAKRVATKIAAEHRNVVQISLCRRMVHPDSNKLELLEIWRRNKNANAKTYKEWIMFRDWTATGHGRESE